ncbi:MAG: MarR family winged helix-turn-helix transcriptional regulator [Stackebrandtia sp.]
MSTPDEDAEAGLVRRWRDLLACYSTVSCSLEAALQDAHGMGLSEFEVIDRLAEADSGPRPMRDLGAEMYLSQSALSRTVARLEREGLVERTMCADDRRAVFVDLTETGRALHDEARPTHRRHLADHLASRPRPTGG